MIFVCYGIVLGEGGGVDRGGFWVVSLPLFLIDSSFPILRPFYPSTEVGKLAITEFPSPPGSPSGAILRQGECSFIPVMTSELLPHPPRCLTPSSPNNSRNRLHQRSLKCGRLIFYSGEFLTTRILTKI